MSEPTMQELFGQLGLANEASAIDAFIDTHKGLDGKVHLEDAPFWNKAQASFIKTAIAEDAEWAEVIDHLDARLR